MKQFEPLTVTEAKVLERQPTLGEGHESKCLPGWIVSLSRWWEASEPVKAGKLLDRHLVGNLLHTLIAARRRNHLMSVEIARLKRRIEELTQGHAN